LEVERGKPSRVEIRLVIGPLVEEGFKLVENGGESGFVLDLGKGDRHSVPLIGFC